MSADFLDSNVLVYLFDDRDTGKQAISRRIVEDALRDNSAVISHQVVQETLNVLRRGMVTTVAPSDLRAVYRDLLLPLWRLSPSPATYERAIDVLERTGYSFYDSLIVAAAIEGGCSRLLSEDLQHGQRIDGLVIEDPFRTATTSGR